MKTIINLFLAFILLNSCSTTKHSSDIKPNGNDEKDIVAFTILQINDFYEIAALENGQIGGAARIATIRKKLLQENPNTICVLAGDFLSPSLLGTLKWEGERIKGKQMVEVLNAVGIDIVTFGNHEFDLDAPSLQKRINESQFEWVSTNVYQKKGDSITAFKRVVNDQGMDIPKHIILNLKNAFGKTLNIGIVAPCLDANKVDYVYYEDVFASIKKEISKIENKVDFILSLSHLSKEDDIKMAKKIPGIHLITGGHEHDNMIYKIGKTILTKADANAKSVYVHRIQFNIRTKKSSVQSKLVILDHTIIPDGQVSQLVGKWKAIENKVVREMGFDPEQILVNLSTPYDAREMILRNMPAAFGEMICRSMSKYQEHTDCSILNSGSIRVDDVLKDKLSQYDILRSLPFGGGIIEVEMKGSLLQKVLDAGWSNKGSGGFLQWDKISRTKDGIWFIGKNPLQLQNTYLVGMNDYLLTGLEKRMEFLKPDNPELKRLYPALKEGIKDLSKDIRLVIIDYLKKGGR